uniref:Uncharacterized protein n=1 Tax=Oryza sativa subsp. japonica TaxID=39947 RepID=Q5Z7C7_ORYSJ|nr:hypothetical protein [Oryza sativa Japonica Group]BAD54187.1 hypothetical protein [Oryza sativa Japonica Group]
MTIKKGGSGRAIEEYNGKAADGLDGSSARAAGSGGDDGEADPAPSALGGVMTMAGTDSGARGRWIRQCRHREGRIPSVTGGETIFRRSDEFHNSPGCNKNRG